MSRGGRTFASAFEKELARRLSAGVARLAHGDLEGGAAQIKGLGYGLTPSGDDFLAGFLLGMHALEMAAGIDLAAERRAVREAARGANPFSEAYAALGRGRPVFRAGQVAHSSLIRGRGGGCGTARAAPVRGGRKLRRRPGRGLAFRAEGDRMVVKGEIKTGVYFDSVTLMIVGRDITAAAGVLDAAVVMGTRENQAILKSAGLWLRQFDAASDTDLLLAVKAASAETAAGALRAADEQLKTVRDRTEAADEWRPLSLEGALQILPGANVALISVAGRYAGEQAMQALKAGLHVMLFSDNVPLAQEIELKKFARSKGLLLMGPDCGTAIVNGVPLAFANAVNRGDIGIVAAAGTGLQEVSSLISNEGAGISQAIGTGGRDVKKEVGGIMFLEGLKALIQDPATRVDRADFQTSPRVRLEEDRQGPERRPQARHRRISWRR